MDMTIWHVEGVLTLSGKDGSLPAGVRAKRPPMSSPPLRSEKLDLRISQEAKRTLQAAAFQSRSLSDFVLDSALQRAAETLPDRQRFGLDDARWKAFLEALDGRARRLPRLGKLLRSRGPFDASR